MPLQTPPRIAGRMPRLRRRSARSSSHESSKRVKAVRPRGVAPRLALNMTLETARRPRGLSLDAAFRVADGLGVELPGLLGFQGLSGTGLEAGRIVSMLGPRLRFGKLALLRAMAPHGKACAKP